MRLAYIVPKSCRSGNWKKKGWATILNQSSEKVETQILKKNASIYSFDDIWSLATDNRFIS